MKLLDRLRIVRETRRAYRANLDTGLSEEAAQDATLAAMKEKYGLTVDWSKILELVILILSLLMKDEP